MTELEKKAIRDGIRDRVVAQEIAHAVEQRTREIAEWLRQRVSTDSHDALLAKYSLSPEKEKQNG